MITFTCPACGHVEKVSPSNGTAPSPAAPQAGPNPPKCPDHGFEWKTNSRGYFCSGKTNGKWCERKPA